jgi:hypothetical protein
MHERKPWLYEGLHRLDGQLLVAAVGPNGTALTGAHQRVSVVVATDIEVAVWLTDEPTLVPRGWHAQPSQRMVLLTGYLLISDGTTTLGQLVVAMGNYRIEAHTDAAIAHDVSSVCMLLRRD